MTKADIRAQIKKKLVTQQESFLQLSQKISKEIIESPNFRAATTILAYSPLADEVDISNVTNAALSAGKKVYLPKINPENNTMDFYPFSQNLTTGSYGILEPETTLKPFSLSQTDNCLVLVPGRAFTKNGLRLGRGKGFYDKYFSSVPSNVHLCGVCFPFQILSEIPTTQQDVKMEKVFYLPSSE